MGRDICAQIIADDVFFGQCQVDHIFCFGAKFLYRIFKNLHSLRIVMHFGSDQNFRIHAAFLHTLTDPDRCLISASQINRRQMQYFYF